MTPAALFIQSAGAKGPLSGLSFLTMFPHFLILWCYISSFAEPKTIFFSVVEGICSVIFLHTGLSYCHVRRLTSTFRHPWQIPFDPSEKQKLLLSESTERLIERIAPLFDGKFIPLVPHASCCPLYRHENKGLNSPVIPFPAVLCSFCLAGNLLCLLESLLSSLASTSEISLCSTGWSRETWRQLPALQKKALELVLAGVRSSKTAGVSAEHASQS